MTSSPGAARTSIETTTERLFTARFVHSALPQAMLGLDGNLLDANDALCRLTGIHRDDMVGRPTTVLHHPADEAYGVQRGEDLFAGRCESATWERNFKGPDGAPMPVLVYATLIRDEHGRPEAVSCFIQDLTLLRQTEQKLSRTTARFEALLTQAVEWALVVDEQANLLYVSPAVKRAFGYEPKVVSGRSAFDFVHPDDRPHVSAAFERLLADPQRVETVVFRALTADGSYVWVEEVTTNRLEDPDIRGIVCNGRDVSDRIDAERALRESEARFRTIAETAQEGIWAINTAGRTLFANQKVAEILGVDLATVYETPVPKLVSPDDMAFIAEKLRRRAERGAESYELHYNHPDGGTRIVRVAVSPLREAHMTGSLAMVTDITDFRRVEEELLRRAVHDDLTGLPNRTLLMDRLEQALARQARRQETAVAVVFIDLDHFKLVNDTWGHALGDELLCQVAARLSSSVRPGDTVARFGGDEFVVVCEDVDERAAQDVARRILETMSVRFDVEGQTVYAGVSVGIALSPPSSAGELLRFADAAMYDAKGRGRGRVQVFDVALAHQAADRLMLSNDLRDALEAGQLEMHYQPIVDLETGAVVTVEALARWQHPVRGMVSPAQFVSVAETSGLGPALDRWALERGTRDAHLLREQLIGSVQVAVNVSAANLGDSTFEHNLLATLRDLQVPPDLLVLEITESALMEQPEQARQTLRRLVERGITAAIDDFGTGYSSLAYLNQLPVKTLKIDRSFIAGLTEDEDAFAIVAAIVDLARTLGLRTVAEGVETPEQLALLRRLGCWGGQGYLWSEPVPLPDLLDTVAARPRGRFNVESDDPQTLPTARRRHDPVTSEHGLHQIMRLHRQGASLTTIAAALNAEGFRTPQGMRWHRASVARVISDVAYPSLAPRE